MERILIADDDFPIRDWLSKCCREILKEDDVEICMAGNGSIALNEFIEKPADILFADIKMPVMNGLELIEKVRELRTDVYIVVLSSYDDFNYARTAFQNRVNEYVLKTEITTELLKNIIERAQKYVNSVKEGGKRTIEVYSFDKMMEELNEKSSPDKKRTLMEKYGIDVPKGSYFCFAVYNEDETYEKLRVIQEEAMNKVFSIRANKAEVYCFSVIGEMSMLYQFQKVNTFMRKLATLNPNHILCYGQIRCDGESVLECAAEVLIGLNYRYYTDAKIFFADNIKSSIKNYKNIDTAVVDLYKKIIEEENRKNRIAINKLVEEWFELIKVNKVFNINMIKNMCQRICDRLKESMDDINAVDSNDIIKKIDNVKNIADFKEVILNTYDKSMDKIVGKHTVSPTIKKALRYIYANYARITGLAEVADHVGISREYFSRLFKEETGVNFSVFLNDYRLDMAMDMLTHTDKKLYEIAEETGFSSLSYFSRKFKEKFDKTPFSYRK